MCGIKFIAIYFPYGLKMMSRNTLSLPQPDSASLAWLILSTLELTWLNLGIFH